MRAIRSAPCALLTVVAIAAAGCGGAATPTVRADTPAVAAPAAARAASPAAAPSASSAASGTAPTAGSASPASTSTAGALPAAPERAAGDEPSTEPGPASIEVRGTADGWHGTATVSGPGGERTASLDAGPATFGGLDDGVYEVRVTWLSDPTPPSDDGVDVGAARRDVRGGSFGLVAGDRAVVSCDTDACTGVL